MEIELQSTKTGEPHYSYINKQVILIPLKTISRTKTELHKDTPSCVQEQKTNDMIPAYIIFSAL